MSIAIARNIFIIAHFSIFGRPIDKDFLRFLLFGSKSVPNEVAIWFFVIQ